MSHIPTLGAQPAWHRPFLRYFDGEQGAAPAGPPAPTPPAPAPQAPAPPVPPAPAPPAPAPPAPQPVQYRGDPDEYVRELREEAKTHRLAAEKAATDFTTAQAERDAAAAERDQLRRDNTIILRSAELGAKASALLDSREFTTLFATVDLTDQAAVDKAITDALERNSAFKAGPTLPTASGGGHQGGQPPTTTPTLESAVKARLGG